MTAPTQFAMSARQMGWLSLYALTYSLVALVGFRFGDVVPEATIYVLLIGLYCVGVVLIIQTNLSAHLGSAVIVSLVGLLGLLVIDPLEVGFYGYDSYATLRAMGEFRSKGPLWLANNRGAWPGFYAFTGLVSTLLGLEAATVGKYIPLVATTIPLSCFVAVRRFAATRNALLAAVGVVGIRTLVGFELKFLDESPAATLLFAMVAVLAIQRTNQGGSRPYTVLLSLLAVVAVLSHHFAGLLVVVMLFVWTLSHSQRAGRLLASLEETGTASPAVKRTLVLASVAFAVLLFVVANAFVADVFQTAVATSSPTQLGPDSGQLLTKQAATVVASDPLSPAASATSDALTASAAAAPPPVSELGGTRTAPAVADSAGAGLGGEAVSSFLRHGAANLVILGLFAFVAYSFLRHRSYSPEELALTGFAALLAVPYGYSILFGRLIPLDPSRYLLFVGAPLILVGAMRLSRFDAPELTRAFTLLVVALAVTQLTLLPPAVWYSDQSETIVGEDHYSPAQFAASDWAADHDGNTVIGWEKGLWTASGIQMAPRGQPEASCDLLHVWRSDTNRQRPPASTVYDAGSIALFKCERAQGARRS